MEFKKDDSRGIQKSSFNLHLGFLFVSTLKGTLQEWQGVPVFSGLTERAGSVCIKVACDNNTGYIKDPKLVIDYLANPSQPLPEMILYKDGHVEAPKKPS